MAYSSGTYTAPTSSWNPAVAGTSINVVDWTALLADLSTALTTCILKDGSQTATALVPFAAGLSAGAAAAFNINSSGVITTAITMNTAASRLIPGGTSFAIRNTANSADNVLVTDAGAVTIRAGATITTGGLTVTVGTTALLGGISLNANSTGFTYGGGDTGQVLINGGGTLSATFGATSITLAPAVTASSTLVVTGKITATTAGIDVPVSALGTCYSSNYTPTVSTTVNVAASTPQTTRFSRVGAEVTVYGYINIDPTAASATSFELNLPVASNLAAAADLTGVCVSQDGKVAGTILGIVANDTAGFEFTPTSTANQSVTFTFSYRVI